MSIQQIVDQHLCTGCGACAFVASHQLRMVDTRQHARRPQPCSTAAGSGQDAMLEAAAAVCPGSSIARDHDTASRQPIPQLLDDWGPVLEVWEGYAVDPQLRYRGSSGGVVNALALFCLEQEQMAGALHVQAREDAPLLNRTVLSRDRASLLAGSGSRYAPASPCEELGQIEAADSACVFIGKPCDVAAASGAARSRPQLADRLGLTIAIFCAGTPSLEGTHQLARSLGASDASQIQHIRYRGHGWPGEMTVRYRDPVSGAMRERSVSYPEGWGNILQKFRPWRCHLCADHTGESADISVGDPWYRPVQPGEHGMSLVLVRSERARQLLRRAMRAGYVQLERRDACIVGQSQPHLLRAQAAVWGRALTCRLLGLSAPRYPGKPLFRLWWRRLSWKQKWQSFSGTVVRIVRRKLYRQENAEPLPVSPGGGRQHGAEQEPTVEHEGWNQSSRGQFTSVGETMPV